MPFIKVTSKDNVVTIYKASDEAADRFDEYLDRGAKFEFIEAGNITNSDSILKELAGLKDTIIWIKSPYGLMEMKSQDTLDEIISRA